MGLVLLCATQTAGAYLFSGSTTQASSEKTEAVPQVLGDAISIRGDLIDQNIDLNPLIKNPDTAGVKAKSFLVFDLKSGQQLLEKNSNQKFSIASLTKLLTGLVAYQNVDLSHEIILTSKDNLKVKPTLSFVSGDLVKASDVFNSMIIGSCNDAALTLANFVNETTGQNFVDLMNRQAQTLGMVDSHFANPMGFDSAGNFSTAQDMKKLITATQSLAVFKNLGRRTNYQFTSASGNYYSTAATNTLIKSHEDIQAIKTGYTGEAGGAMATKIKIGEREIVVLVLNSTNREEDTLRLREILLQNIR